MFMCDRLFPVVFALINPNDFKYIVFPCTGGLAVKIPRPPTFQSYKCENGYQSGLGQEFQRLRRRSEVSAQKRVNACARKIQCVRKG